MYIIEETAVWNHNFFNINNVLPTPDRDRIKIPEVYDPQHISGPDKTTVTEGSAPNNSTLYSRMWPMIACHIEW